MRTLEEKTVIVTGASRGIGRAIAERLARDGARLAVCGRDEDALADVRVSIERLGAGAVFVAAFDLADDARLDEFVAGVKGSLGTVDVLINNAGFNPRKAPLHEVDDAEIDAVFAVNMRAPFRLMRDLHSEMKAAGGGHIVNILSTVCHADMETMGAYTAAKNGLQSLTRIFRKEVRADNIRVTSIYPGGTDTDFRPNARPDYMLPESVAEAVYSALTMPQDLVMHEMTFRPMIESNF
jgi:NAD(P)-dependent dehydrogenase (short-subunit alcohol dehydrogenase family)